MIKIDFYADWIEHQKQFLQEQGYPVETLTNPAEISIAYFNAQKRMIPNKKRNIYKSDVFLCPTDLERGLHLLENKIHSGTDINPHLSSSLKRILYNDYLLNDWGIYHFHLGREINNEGYVTRTGPLLFGFITHDSFYEINIYNHGDWSNTDLIEIVHRNWPDVINEFRLNDVVDLPFTNDSTTVTEFRKNQINSLIKVADGTVYCPPGSGYSTNGTAIDVSIKALKYKKFMDNLQKEVTKNLAHEILTAVEKLGYTIGEEIEFKLLIENGWVYAFCEQYDVKFKLASLTA